LLTGGTVKTTEFAAKEEFVSSLVVVGNEEEEEEEELKNFAAFRVSIVGASCGFEIGFMDAWMKLELLPPGCCCC
jgi:hypothetical protein